MSSDKFFVGLNFRKNKLAEKPSPLSAEVHKPGSPVKIYDNIHYPTALARKIFKSSPDVTHIEIKNSEDNTSYIIENK